MKSTRMMTSNVLLKIKYSKIRYAHVWMSGVENALIIIPKRCIEMRYIDHLLILIKLK